MEDILGILATPLIVFMVIVAPIWLVLHYRAKGRIGAGFADNEREQLQGLLDMSATPDLRRDAPPRPSPKPISVAPTNGEVPH